MKVLFMGNTLGRVSNIFFIMQYFFTIFFYSHVLITKEGIMID